MGGEKHYKTFGLTQLALKNRISVQVILYLTVFVGLYSYLDMPRESFPEIVVPEVYVSTVYPGNASEDIERLVTKPIEEYIDDISEVDEITSSSKEGYSSIRVVFKNILTPDEALRKVKDKVDKATSDKDFPNDLPVPPNVFKLNMAELAPVMNVNLSGDFSQNELRTAAEYLEDVFKKIPEVSDVAIRGLQNREVEVSVDLAKLESLQITFTDIAQAIQQENITMSGGKIFSGGYRKNIRVTGEFEDFKMLRNLVVASKQNRVVFLKDVAEVRFKEMYPPDSYARFYDDPVVMVSVMKRSGENLIALSEKINALIAQAQKKILPKGMRVEITNDQSESTKSQVVNLENNIIFGMLLVFLVLMIFMGVRSAFFVGMAIPLSMMISFLVLSFMGITLNTMVLFGLVLALGMLVDNGVVVVENIYRVWRLEDCTPLKASAYGTGEVSVSIIAATATTLSAFFPMMVWPGTIGEFMRFLPLTLIVVLLSSLFVALVINPVLASLYMAPAKINRSVALRKYTLLLFGSVALIALSFLLNLSMVRLMGNVLFVFVAFSILNLRFITPFSDYFQREVLPKFEAGYSSFLAFALRGKNPYVFFSSVVVLLIFSIGLFGLFTPKILFFPENDPQQIFIYIEHPVGTDIDKTNRFTHQIEKEVRQYIRKFDVKNQYEDTENYMVTSVVTNVGMGSTPSSMGPSMEETPHRSKITLNLSYFEDRRGFSSSRMLNELRGIISDYPGIRVTVEKNAIGPPSGYPISLSFEGIGMEYREVMQWGKRVKSIIEKSGIQGIEGLQLDVNTSVPQIPVRVDREKARRYGISTGQIATAIRTAVYGMEASTYKTDRDDFPINIRLNNSDRYDQDAVMNQKITFRDRKTNEVIQVPISALVSVGREATFDVVRRDDLNQTVTLFSNVLEDYNANEITKKIKKLLSGVDDFPSSLKINFTGQQEQQGKEMSFLLKALSIAVMLIFLILVSQFNSVVQPLIIVASVVLSLIGVFLGLIVFRMDFIVIMTMIGIISLAGIVVNNAIVLIDYTNLIIRRKSSDLELLPEEKLSKTDLKIAIIEAGKTRLRPVILTAITTVLGLVPLAVGMNIDFAGLFSDYSPNIYFGGDNVAFWGPIAWTIIFGLVVATFLTLVIIPVIYYLTQIVAVYFVSKRAKA